MAIVSGKLKNGKAMHKGVVDLIDGSRRKRKKKNMGCIVCK